MDYFPSQDFYQGRRVEKHSTASADVDRELTGMELLVRGLEDADKRLDQLDGQYFTDTQLQRWQALVARLYTLTL